MAAGFSQDSVFRFLQSRGGSVKNADLLLHFRSYIREDPDREQNRQLFKRFVNSLATVQQVDGVAYVVLRRKFQGKIPGGGEQSFGAAPGRRRDASPGSDARSPAGGAGGLPAEPALPAAGIVPDRSDANLSQRPRPGSGPEVSPRPAAAQVGTPPPAQPRPHLATAGRHSRGPGDGGQWTQVAVGPPPQPASRHRHRKSYTSAVSHDNDDDDDDEEPAVAPVWAGTPPLGSAGKARSASPPSVAASPAPSSSPSSSPARKPPEIYIQNVGGDRLPGSGLTGGSESDLGPGPGAARRSPDRAEAEPGFQHLQSQEGLQPPRSSERSDHLPGDGEPWVRSWHLSAGQNRPLRC